MKKKLTDLLPDAKRQVLMKDHTTLRVGGMVDYFIEVKSADELIKAVKSAISLNIPYFILGGGSNILFSDYGFAGLVIKNSTSNIAVMKEKSQIIADSGVKIAKVVIEAISNDLAGIEFLYGVPGTIGGAVYGNAGAYGAAIGDYVKSLTILQLDSENNIPKVVQKESNWMEFSYRSTKLKKIKSKTKPVILSVRFQFSRNQKEELMRRLHKYQQERIEHQPIGLSAGCVFKNPIPLELKNITGSGTKGMPELPKERTAGYILQQSGVKNLKIGQAEVSEKHANFIINRDGAKAKDMRSLIEAMRERAHEHFGVILEEEIEYIGQW